MHYSRVTLDWTHFCAFGDIEECDELSLEPENCLSLIRSPIFLFGSAIFPSLFYTDSFHSLHRFLLKTEATKSLEKMNQSSV